MSDVIYNVEDGAPPPDPTPEPAPAPAAAAPEPVAEPEPAREPEVEVDGQRMVPLAALLAERQSAKELKQKADQFDHIASEWHNARPYIDFLKNNPDLMKPRQAEPAPAPVKPEDDPELVDIARTLDLYTAEGKPDVGRAKKIQDREVRLAQKVAQEAVQPLHQTAVQQQAQVNLQHAMALDFNGHKANPQVLQQIWRTTDPKVLATEQGAAAAVLMAMGLGSVQPQQAPAPQASLQPPVVTEPSGGRNVGRPAMSEFEEKAIRVRGLDAKKYGDYTKNFKPGQVNALED